MNYIHDTSKIVRELADLALYVEKNPDFTLEDYAWHNLTTDLMVSTINTLYPRCIIYNNGCFLESCFTSNVYNEWMTHFNGVLYEVESIMNHKHVSDLFIHADKCSAELKQYLANSIAILWRLSLSHQYPSRNMNVIVNTDDELQDCIITFYTIDI